MQHASLLDALLMPVFMIVILSSIAGAKPEAILSPILGLASTVIQAVLSIVFAVTKVLVQASAKALTRLIDGH